MLKLVLRGKILQKLMASVVAHLAQKIVGVNHLLLLLELVDKKVNLKTGEFAHLVWVTHRVCLGRLEEVDRRLLS